MENANRIKNLAREWQLLCLEWHASCSWRNFPARIWCHLHSHSKRVQKYWSIVLFATVRVKSWIIRFIVPHLISETPTKSDHSLLSTPLVASFECVWMTDSIDESIALPPNQVCSNVCTFNNPLGVNMKSTQIDDSNELCTRLYHQFIGREFDSENGTTAGSCVCAFWYARTNISERLFGLSWNF